VPDEDLILELDALADERVALHLAARPNDHATLDLHERAHARAVADPASVEVRERLDDDVAPELDAVDQAERSVVGRRVRYGRK
jgi:hypothetical protein